MSRYAASLAFLCALITSPAGAQTLRFQVEAEASAQAAPPLPVAPRPEVVVGEPPAVSATPRPIVIVPPLSEDDRPVPAMPEPPPVPSATPAPPTTPAAGERPVSQAWVGYFGLVEGLDLSSVALSMGRPEISAITGALLDSRWEGMRALSGLATGGGGLTVGMRTEGILRLPEFRFTLSGGDAAGEFFPVRGTSEDFEMAVRSVVLLRAEVAAGVQLEIGPFAPYALLRASAAAYWLGVEVRHSQLGGLGGEVMDTAIFEAGIEVGSGFRVDRDLEFNVGVRANFAGPPSVGVLFGMAVGGS